jgi:hypothetical protein
MLEAAWRLAEQAVWVEGRNKAPVNGLGCIKHTFGSASNQCSATDAGHSPSHEWFLDDEHPHGLLLSVSHLMSQHLTKSGPELDLAVLGCVGRSQ